MENITIIVPLALGTEIESIDEIKRQKIKCVSVRGNNPSENRNKGIDKAKTKYVAFINGHTTISENWAKEVEIFFKKYPEIDIVGGPQLTAKDEELFGKASGYALSSKFGAATASTRYKQNDLNLNADETMLTSANLICRQKVFKKVRFDETLYPGEDPKFISDAIAAGFKVAYSPDIFVYNKRRDDIISFIAQMFNYGFTRPKKESLLETLKTPFFLVPPIFVIYLLMAPFLFFLTTMTLWPIYAYVIVNLLASLYETIKNKNILAFFLMPLLFTIVHIGYGSGFILGTLKKLKEK